MAKVYNAVLVFGAGLDTGALWSRGCGCGRGRRRRRNRDGSCSIGIYFIIYGIWCMSGI